MKEHKNPIFRIIISLLVLLLSILLLVAISVDIMRIVDDHMTLKSARLDLTRIIRLQFPAVSNPIGPFGAFFGYWLILLLGKFFSISLLLAAGLLGLTGLLWPEDRKLSGRIICFIVFAFFFNFLLFILKEDIIPHSGILTGKFFGFLVSIFQITGTFIISLMIVIVSLILIFEPGNLKSFFIWMGRSVYLLCAKVISLFRIRRKIKKGTEPQRSKEVKISQQTIIPEVDPRIIEQAIGQEAEERKTVVTPPQHFHRVIPRTSENGDEREIKKEYQKPDIEEFLTSTRTSKRDIEDTRENIRQVSNILIRKLSEFGVEAEVINVNIGPIITQYEIKPAPGIKVSRFNALADDLALAIKATSIRVQAPIPGRGLVGIEVPNINRDTIFLKDILLSEAMQSSNSKLAIALGKDIAGNPIVDDLSQMPHLLIAGATGSGKSVCVNTIIVTLLFRCTPEEVRLILIDPKRIELSGFEGIPHLIQQVVTDNEHALTALNWGVSEMERRYDLLQKYRAKNLQSYNETILKLKDKGEAPEDEVLPYIIIVVDELADLMMTVGREVERPITRLAQMARAIGLHLILATQRPSIKVITGIIKANFPSRIAFKVSSKVDSRVIIDANGAEKLLGLGDMLFLPPGKGNPFRIHGAYIAPGEVHNLVDYLRTQPKPEQEITIIDNEQGETADGEFDYDDELFPEAAVAVVTAGAASVSMLQRHFKIGYARAGRLIDMLEQAGIIGPYVGSKSREVTASEEDLRRYGYLEH